MSPEFFLPSPDDVKRVKTDQVVLISHLLMQCIPGLTYFANFMPKLIQHKYSKVMSNKSEVLMLDVLMKNEA